MTARQPALGVTTHGKPREAPLENLDEVVQGAWEALNDEPAEASEPRTLWFDK